MSEEERSESTVPESIDGEERQLSQEQVDKIIKNRLEQERKKFERQKAEILKPYENIDLEEVSRLKKEAEERENKKLEEQGKFEEIRKKWAQEKSTLESEYEKKIQEKEEMLKKLYLGDKIRNAALKSGVYPDDIEDVIRLTDHFFRLDEDGSIRVLDEKEQETSDSLEDFFNKTYKEKKPKFYQGSNATGPGVKGGTTRATGPNYINFEDRKAFGQNLEKIARGEMKVIR